MDSKTTNGTVTDLPTSPGEEHATLECHDVVCSFGAKRAVDGVSVTIRRAVHTGLLGPNGSGKTTLLRCLAGMHTPDSGRVLLNGTPLRGVPGRQRAKHLAVVGQHDDFAEGFTARSAVMVGRAAHVGPWQALGDTDHDVVNAVLAELELQDLADRAVTQMSGGERQRVVVGRALAQDAPLLLLDEPTNHLDIAHQHALMRLIHRRCETTVTVLHDVNLAAQHCEEVIVMDSGRVVASGATKTVLTAELLSGVYGVDVEAVGNRPYPQFLLG